MFSTSGWRRVSMGSVNFQWWRTTWLMVDRGLPILRILHCSHITLEGAIIGVGDNKQSEHSSHIQWVFITEILTKNLTKMLFPRCAWMLCRTCLKIPNWGTSLLVGRLMIPWIGGRPLYSSLEREVWEKSFFIQVFGTHIHKQSARNKGGP